MVILTNFETNSLPQRIKYMQFLVEASSSKHIFGVPCSIYVDIFGPKIIRWFIPEGQPQVSQNEDRIPAWF